MTWLIPVILLLGGCGSDQKNVILVVVDTMRADRMSLYGYERPTTPELEKFAASAVTFDRAYSPSSWTRPSVASFFTGLYPSTHGCETKDDALDASHQTLAELFQESGYTTVGFHTNGNIGEGFGFGQGFDRYEKIAPNASYPDDHEIADAKAVNAQVQRWLSEERPDEPWFLFVLYIDPHDPYLPHDEHWFGPPHEGEFYEGSRKHLKKMDTTGGRTYRGDRKTISNLYDGEIAYVDSQLGQLFRTLDEEGLTDDTVVMVTSDHGECLWDHGEQRAHGRLLYEELIHVPLIVRWPELTAAGTRVAEPVHAFGLFGALVEGFDLPARHQAPSLMSYFDGTAPLEPIFVENNQPGVELRAWIEWPRKVIFNATVERGEKYNLVGNPNEEMRKRTRRDMPAEFVAAMDSASTVNAEWRAGIEFTGAAPQPTEEEIEALRALGYIE